MKTETVQEVIGSAGEMASETELIGRPKILVLEGASRIGGGQQVTLNIAESLRDRATFEVIVPGGGKLENELKSGGIKSHRVSYPAPAGKFSLPDRALYLPLGSVSLVSLISLIRKSKPDLLYATSRTALWAAIAGRITGTPVIVHLHMIPATDRTAWFLKRICSMKQVERVLIVSNAIADRMSLPPDKIRIVPNGIELPETPARPELRSEIRSEFGLANSTHVAAVVGELLSEKGQLEAIKALAQTTEAMPDAVLLLVGTAREGSEKHHQRLRLTVSELGLEQRVIFAGHRDDVARLLNGVDLLIVPSAGPSGEACPLAVLEAWATGVPVLGANTGGLPEMLGERRGAIFDDDGYSLATEWQRLFRDQPRMDALSRAGLEAVKTDYSLNRASERILTAVNEAISG